MNVLFSTDAAVMANQEAGISTPNVGSPPVAGFAFSGAKLKKSQIPYLEAVLSSKGKDI